MINKSVYDLLKKGIEAKAFGDYEEMQAKNFCQEYEKYRQEQIEKQEAHEREMKNLMFNVLSKANKPLCPTEIQFILYREIGKEYACATIAYYCVRLCWEDKKLIYKRKGSRAYYSIKKD